MLSSMESQYIRLEVIGGRNIKAPSKRIPAGIYISINVNSRRRWKSSISVLSYDESVAWGDTVTLSSHESPALSVEIRAAFELDRMLGNGEVIGKIYTSWDELLDYGSDPFELSFPPVCGVNPSLELKAAGVHACDNQDSALFDSLVDRVIARETDAGHVRLAKYMRGKRVSHLNNAIGHFQLVVARCPVDHPDRAAALTNLAWAHLELYVRKNLQDIDTTTSLFRAALALRPQGHPDHTFSLFNLILILNWRYSKERTAVYIHESLQLCRKLMPLCPEGTDFRIGVDIVVGYVISECNNLLIDASNEGIDLRRNVLELCPLRPGQQYRHPIVRVRQKYRPIALDKLSGTLSTRFQQYGSIDDMDESIQLARKAVSMCREGHSYHGYCLDNLAMSLQFRFNHQGNSHDLDEVISIYEEVLRLHPVGDRFRDVPLDRLGTALCARFNKRGDIDDIDRAISLYREALMLRSPGHSDHGTALNNLGRSLRGRYEKLHVIEDLNEAIDLHRKSLRVIPLDHPHRHRNLSNLGSALCRHFMRTQKNKHIEEAIRLCQESLVSLPSLHPDRSFSYIWLQEAYLSRYKVQHDPADLSLAVENFRLASRHPTQGFPNRLRYAHGWTVVAEQHGDGSALEAYSTFFELLDAHLGTRSSITSRREAAAAFHYARSLPVDAASCAIRCDNCRHAVELVERGRGQQWTLASRLKTPVEDLESGHPHVAHKFSELSKCISNAAQGAAADVAEINYRKQTEHWGVLVAAADVAETNYRKQTEQWGVVVAEIRNLPGFSRFLLPPLYEDLQAAARYGPVIILIASEYSCSAIIVPTSGQPHHVRFPRITFADLEKLKDDFATAIRHAARMHPQEPRKKLRVRLRILWDEIMLPIVNVLQHDLKLQHRSRIWLCPTAAFTSIPLHAANPFRMNRDRTGNESCLEDLYICSYTPTLSALIRAQQAMKTRATPSFAAIGQGQPGAGQGDVLPAVDSELELVHTLVPPNVKFTNLSKDEATRAGALSALQCNTWVHLACHGKQDLEQPYNSCFAMRDKPVTLLDIMENNSPHAEFAFLSACHTAVGDEEAPDEAIHLAAGLQFSGFKSVIGTLWGVNDALAKHVVEAFYEKMFEDLEDGVIDCTKAAWALNRATHAVMTKVPLEQRMVFIHIGV